MRSHSGLNAFFFGMLVLASASAQALASSKPVEMNELHLQNLGHGPDKAVSVFYTSGRAAMFQVDKGVPAIRTLELGPVRSEIDSSGNAIVPGAEVRRKGFQIFNYLVIVVHSAKQQEVLIRNPDGSIPTAQGPQAYAGQDLSDFDSERIIYLPVRLDATKTSVTQIGSQNVAPGQPVTLDLGAGN